jgi:very-short-patch-repair endonuclease
MHPELRAITARQYGAFGTAQALAFHTPAEVRARIDAGEWLRVFTGSYRRHDSEPTARLRVSAAGLSVGRPVAACLATAAELHGFGVLDDPDTHVLAAPDNPFARRPGLWPHQLVLARGDVATLACGTRATTAARTAVDLARAVPRLDALAVLDAARAAGVAAAALAVELERHVGLRGVVQARELVPLADARAQSPQESRLRLHCHDARLPAPTPQLRVRDDRGRSRYLDLGWEEVKVGLEYDGEEGHDGPENRRGDRRRHNFLEDDGWAMFYATDLDVYRDHALLMARVARAIARRSRAGGGS